MATWCSTVLLSEMLSFQSQLCHFSGGLHRELYPASLFRYCIVITCHLGSHDSVHLLTTDQIMEATYLRRKNFFGVSSEEKKCPICLKSPSLQLQVGKDLNTKEQREVVHREIMQTCTLVLSFLAAFSSFFSFLCKEARAIYLVISFGPEGTLKAQGLRKSLLSKGKISSVFQGLLL